jgi:aldose 1-epimerase
MEVHKEKYGRISDSDVYQFIITNDQGVEIRVIEYGGIVTHLLVPDKNGQKDDIVCGFDTLEGYLGDHPYFGAIIGRYGNRIAGGKFNLEDKEYNLPINNGGNCLHGGIRDFSKHLWKGEVIREGASCGIKLSRTSPHLEEGFPGNLEVSVTYLLNNKNEWSIHYNAITDKPTVVNMTNHSYFNLSGHGNGTILNHFLAIDADYFTPVNDNMIPIGIHDQVENTAFDFRKGKTVGRDIKSSSNKMIKDARGYDVNYVLNGIAGQIRKVATLTDEASGRSMTVHTDTPGMQLYCSYWLEGILGKDNRAYFPYCAACLETQYFPDAPNQPLFPSTILRPEKSLNSTTRYTFSWK